MNEKRNVKLRDALLRTLAIATFSAVSATAFTPVAQARVLLDEVNDGDCDLGNDDTGNGSAETPFRISTVEDLAEIGDCDKDAIGDVYYSLENDLDISPEDNFSNGGTDWNTTDGGWEPIGEYHNVTFSGHFDGNGHTISGFYIDNTVGMDDYVGLFSQTEDAVFKDLTITGEIDADEYDNIGMLAGTDTNSVITNVHIDAEINNGGDTIGALIGDASGTRISNVTTTGTVSTGDGSTYVGGVVGYIDAGSDDAAITDVFSDVVVNDPLGSFDSSAWVGGVAGYTDDTRILRASFDGSVTGSDYAGGIVGEMYDSVVHEVTVTSDARVVVTAGQDADWVGGVIGNMHDSTISNSEFHGTLDADLDGYDVDEIGGIVGEMWNSYLVNALVGSAASITITGYDDSSDDVGGVVGNAHESTISGATMNADLRVINVEHVGGIVGGLEDSEVDSSVNRGDIHVTLDEGSFDSASVGGLVGNMTVDYTGSSLTNSTNKGDVLVDGIDETYAVGGLVGEAESSVITDNYNTGDVTGFDHVGGVVGMLQNQDITIERNFSLGGLVGVNSDPDGIGTLEVKVAPDADLEFNEPSNVVLDSDRADNEIGATVMTRAELKTASLLAGLGWLINNVDRADWRTNVAFNSGYPYLAWETISEDISDQVGLVDLTFDQIVTFPGAKRATLRTFQRNALNQVIELVNLNPYDTVEVHVFYGAKPKLAAKRGLNVKRWLVRQGVAQTISVEIHQADNDNPIGSVTIDALID